jgi:hypothetical protein
MKKLVRQATPAVGREPSVVISFDDMTSGGFPGILGAL